MYHSRAVALVYTWIEGARQPLTLRSTGMVTDRQKGIKENREEQLFILSRS